MYIAVSEIVAFFSGYYQDVRHGIEFSKNNIEREDRDSRKGSSFFHFFVKMILI